MYKNPNYTAPAEIRFQKYKPFVDEFIKQLPAEKESFTFEDVRAYFMKHPNPDLVAVVPKMTDGVLDDLCQRSGLKREL